MLLLRGKGISSHFFTNSYRESFLKLLPAEKASSCIGDSYILLYLFLKSDFPTITS